MPNHFLCGLKTADVLVLAVCLFLTGAACGALLTVFFTTPVATVLRSIRQEAERP